jgi:hypothetical protein
MTLPPHLLDELARAFAEAALDRLSKDAGPSPQTNDANRDQSRPAEQSNGLPSAFSAGSVFAGGNSEQY